MTARAPFLINNDEAKPGRRTQLEIPIARLISGAPVALPVIVLHGAAYGKILGLGCNLLEEVEGVRCDRCR
jgi:hypothetical protein